MSARHITGWASYEKALAFYSEPLRTWQDLGNKRNEAITLKHTAVALRDLGRLEEAKVNIEKCIALMEFIREHAGNAAQHPPSLPTFSNSMSSISIC